MCMCQRAGKHEIIGIEIERGKPLRGTDKGKLLENRKGEGKETLSVHLWSFFFSTSLHADWGQLTAINQV